MLFGDIIKTSERFVGIIGLELWVISTFEERVAYLHSVGSRAFGLFFCLNMTALFPTISIVCLGTNKTFSFNVSLTCPWGEASGFGTDIDSSYDMTIFQRGKGLGTELNTSKTKLMEICFVGTVIMRNERIRNIKIMKTNGVCHFLG